MEMAAGMMIGVVLLYIIIFGLSIAWFVFMIILMIKANKALGIWIRKNDDTIMPMPPYPPSYPVPPVEPTVQTNSNEGDK